MAWFVKHTSEYDIDIGAQRAAALHNLAQHIEHQNQHGNDIPIVDQYEVKSGNVIIDKFEPFYFDVAFSLIFTYCAGMPDLPSFGKRPRYRGKSGAPRVEVPLWVRILSRRVESSVSHDWNLGFVTWSDLFRSEANSSRTIYAHERQSQRETGDKTTAADLEAGSIKIARAM